MTKALPNAATSWFRNAEDDEQTLLLLVREHGSPRVTCFLAHQAAEKYLKAVLVAHGEPIDSNFKTHNLLRLYERTIAAGMPKRDDISAACKSLNDYYVTTRYPDEEEELPTSADLAAAVRAVALVRRAVAPFRP